MQAFSNMRRNSADQKYLKLFFLSALMVLGQIMSSLYPFIPSFVGLLFCYILLNFHKEESLLPIFFAFVYLTFYDINRGFYLFSYVILFFLFYRFAVEKIQNMTTCSNCILTTYVFVAYLGHYALNCLFAYLTNMPFPYFSNHYFYYIAFDSIFAFMLFRVSR